MFTRALLAFIALPGLVAFVAPLLIAWPDVQDGSFRWIALVPLLTGVFLLLWCVRDVYVTGKGTLAPWDPPRRLVVAGPYHVSRNPMYIAVSLVLVGWAIGFRSWVLLLYAVTVMVAFHLRVVFSEEPWLARTHKDEWKRYAARVPRWVFPSRKALRLACLSVALALPVAGLIYEAYADARDAREFPPPGILVDVGGRRLHLICIGEGEPIVLFESSGWGSALSSPAVRERVATRTRVCSYDRPGTGWSDAGQGVASVASLARDLAVLQDRAKLRAPFVIVAASIGGLTAEMFAREFPERVAGLVFVDAASSLSLPLLASRSGTVTAAACTASTLAHFGLVRLLDPLNIGEDSEDARRAAAIAYNTRAWGQTCAMARGLSASQQEFDRAAPLPDDIPLIVLSASSATDLLPSRLERFVSAETLSAGMRGTHQQLAKRSTRGTWQMVPASTHLIGNSQPDAVADAVLQLLDDIR